MSSSFPNPLTEKEEQYYVKLLEENDPDARLVLIERNLRLVAHIAKKYAGMSSDEMPSNTQLSRISVAENSKALFNLWLKDTRPIPSAFAKAIPRAIPVSSIR